MTETTSTIYPLPRPGLPYLVVTFEGRGLVEASPARTRDEARAAAVRKNIAAERLESRKTAIIGTPSR